MTKRKIRKQLNADLSAAVYRSLCGEHYHTSNPPEFPGYIITERQATELRRIAAQIQGLKRRK